MTFYSTSNFKFVAELPYVNVRCFLAETKVMLSCRNKGCHRLPHEKECNQHHSTCDCEICQQETLKLCFSVKRTLIRKVTYLLAIRFVLISGFYEKSAKNCREKVGLPIILSWSRRHGKGY